MKKSLGKGIVGVALMAALAACSDTFEPGGASGTGTISPAVGINTAVVSSRQGRAEAADVTADMLSLRLTSADGTFSRTWDRMSDFDADTQFKVGEYTLEAFYGDADTEGFESPYFYGSQTIKVQDRSVTRVSLTATVANAMVSVFYTPEFREYMADWSAEVHSAGGAYTTYAKDETRPVYVKPGQVDLSISLTKPNGVSATIQAASFNVEARHHYRMTFGLNQDTGDATLTIIFDESLDEDPRTIELSDELMNAPAPELAAEGFSDGEPVVLIPGQAASSQLAVNVIARGGIRSAMLTVQSASLAGQGWPSELDLVNLSADMCRKLTALGLSCRGLYANPDKFAVVDFTRVSEHIAYVADGDNVSSFTLRVVDNYGKTSQPLTLKTEVQPLAIALSNPGVLFIGGSEVEVDLSYNGGEPSENVVIQYRNERNTWSDATVTYAGLSDGLYRGTLTGLPEGADDLVIRAKAGGLTSPELTVPRQSIELQAVVTGSASFATRVAVGAQTVQRTDGINLGAVLSKSRLMLSSDGGNTYTEVAAEVDGEGYLLSGLTPASTYKVKIEVPGAENNSPAAEFTTESAQQIPNGNLDANVTVVSSKSNWENIAFEGWGTNNTMTTSQGSGLFGNYAYDAVSGTIQTTDAHSGKAALIRTVGWGSGNTAVGSNGGSGKTKYRDAGLLHLGATRSGRPSGYGENDHNGCGPVTTDDLDCGITFASRPSALSFWYKYTPKNSADAGLAEISVLDAGGNVIATGRISLGAASSYTRQTVELAYPADAAKAAKLYVRFQSTADMRFLEKNDQNFSGPGFGNSKGTYMGSQLYIDDVELIY